VGPSLRNAPRPEVHFLIQFTQPLLSSVGPLAKDTWAYYQSDGKPTEGPANGMNTANEQLLLDVEKEPANNPLNQSNVVGVDILSPEKNIITPDGKNNFKRLIRAIYGFAQKTNRRMLVRSHCGEGMPLEKEEKEKTPNLDAVPPVTLTDPATGKPLHYRLARFNVQGLLEAVEEFRTNLATDQERARFDDYVIIRFGHVSHASQKQAQRMATDHVWADVCLTSNITTRAISHLHDHPPGLGDRILLP
jgi:hypothetical protein